MGSSELVFSAILEAVPGREDELKKALFELVAPSRGEEGCLTYELHVDPNQRGRFLFYESFADETAHRSHLATPHFLRFKAIQEHEPALIKSVSVNTWQKIS